MYTNLREKRAKTTTDTKKSITEGRKGGIQVGRIKVIE